jgi:hypothetical protein
VEPEKNRFLGRYVKGAKAGVRSSARECEAERGREKEGGRKREGGREREEERGRKRDIEIKREIKEKGRKRDIETKRKVKERDREDGEEEGKDSLRNCECVCVIGKRVSEYENE